MTGSRVVQPLKREALAAMETKALLGRLAALRRLEETDAGSDWNADFASADEIAERARTITCKDSDWWRLAYAEVKAELATREHVVLGSKERRQDAAWNKKHR